MNKQSHASSSFGVADISVAASCDSSFFDIKKVLKLEETEQKYKEVEYELEQIRIENSQLKGNFTKE